MMDVIELESDSEEDLEGLTWFVCEYCGRAFVEPEKLNAHRTQAHVLNDQIKAKAVSMFCYMAPREYEMSKPQPKLLALPSPSPDITTPAPSVKVMPATAARSTVDSKSSGMKINTQTGSNTTKKNPTTAVAPKSSLNLKSTTGSKRPNNNNKIPAKSLTAPSSTKSKPVVTASKSEYMHMPVLSPIVELESQKNNSNNNMMKKPETLVTESRKTTDVIIIENDDDIRLEGTTTKINKSISIKKKRLPASASTSKTKCTTCHRTFSNPQNLIVHTRYHTGERPFKCEYENCDKSFINSSNLRVHIRSHTKEKPFVCHCGKTFSTTSNLKIHQKVHDKNENGSTKRKSKTDMQKSSKPSSSSSTPSTSTLLKVSSNLFAHAKKVSTQN